MSSHEKVVRAHINTFLRDADACIAKAQQPDAGNPTAHYDKALALLKSARQWEKNTTLLDALDKRIAAVSLQCSAQPRHPTVVAAGPPKAAPPKDASGSPPSSEPPAVDDAGDVISDDKWIMKGACNVQFDDIAGLANVKRMIKDALVLSRQYPMLYAETPPVRGIMLYGPSGTGKTQLVRAMATEMKWTVLTADSAEIFSRWQGDSEKAMKSLFAAARRRKPCIVFIDEADGILGESSGNDKSGGDSKARVRDQFQTVMDGIETDANERDMVVVIATNYPWRLPPAVKRRFQKQIEIPLPDAEGRAALVAIALRGRTHALSEADVATVVAATERYSGADIQRVAGEAFMRPIHRVQQATHFVQRDDGLWTPCDADTPEAVERSWTAFTDAELARQPVTVADWLDCLQLIKPTNEPAMLATYEDYTRKLGARY